MGVFTRSPAPGAGARQAEALPYAAPRSFTASAQRVRMRDRNDLEALRQRYRREAWQRDAWDYYDLIAEVKFAFGLLGSVTSRIRLYPAAVLDPQAVPVPVADAPAELAPPELAGAAATLLGRISSSRGGQPALMRELAINLSVPGECFLVQEPARQFPSPVPEDWNIRSTDELVLDAQGRLCVRESEDARPTEYRVLPADAFVGRIWRSHPRWSGASDSSMRGVLDLCADLLLLTRAARATARSRLNAGAIYLPDGLSAAAAPGYAASPSDPAAPPEEADEFEEELVAAMVTPIAEEDSASAVVPLIIRGPAELADKIKQFKFERSFDPALAERADRLLERILQGLDVPKEVVTGLQNLKYSNAIVLDQALYKAHVEPLALLICDSITSMWLRPALRELGFPEDQVRRMAVWYDPSEVVMQPDKSDDADQGYDRYLLSGSSWRRAHGFSDADAPDGEELAYRMLVDKGQILPETAEMLLTRFAPDVMAAVSAQSAPSSLPPEVQQALGIPAAPPAAPAPPSAPPAPGQPPAEEERVPLPPALQQALGQEEQ